MDAQKSILIVDDEHDVRQALRALLERNGYLCHVASNGVEALELLDSGTSVDLFIVDLRMPGMSGSQLVTTLRTSRELSTPIIILTALFDSATIELTLKESSDFYIVKPIEPEAFLTAVSLLLREGSSRVRHQLYSQLLGNEKVYFGNRAFYQMQHDHMKFSMAEQHSTA